MAKSGKNLWQKLSLVHPSSERDRADGLKLFREYTHRGYLQSSSVSKQGISSGGVVDFFRRLSLLRSTSSPVCRRRDARWMSSSDFQIYNIRECGSFFRAVRDLPFLRTDAIVLLPVTRIQEDFPLYPVSHSILDPDLADPLLDDCGFSLEEQFRLFLAAAHLCGLKTGYFLSPLIAPDSAVIYRKPEFFNWLKNGREPDSREEIFDQVRTITAEEFKRMGEYDYPLIRERVNAASLTAVTVPREEDTVFFNLENGSCREYFADIFLNLQIRYSLDFIFLSLPEGMEKEAACKTVHLVQNPARGDLKKYTGWIVDHPVAEYEGDFQEITNLFSSRMTRVLPLREEQFHDWFHKLGELFEINREKRVPYSRTVPLSGKNLSRSEALSLYFLTRFSGIARYRRPLLIDPEFLGDPDFQLVQNRIEDVYTRYLDVLKKGKLLKVVADESYAWWIIRERGRILISFLSLNQNNPEEKSGSVRIDYSEFVSRSKILTVVEYDFSSSQGSLFLSADNSLSVNDLQTDGFRLFSLQ